MLRKFIFMDPAAKEELVMPVTPEGYEIEHGRKVNSLTMHTVGAVNLPGPAVLLDQELEFLLPAHDYPFNQPGTNLNPFTYLEKLEKWSDTGTVLRFVVSDTPVNAAVLLDPIRYREEDGTNDIYVTVPIRGYRQLAAASVQGVSGAAAERAVDAPAVTQTSYTVVRGDTLSGICRRFYGDASAAMAARVAAHNGIKNVNLIYPGQVLRLPDAAQLPAASAAGSGAVKREDRAEPEAKSAAKTVTLSVMNLYYQDYGKLGVADSTGVLKVGANKYEHGVPGTKSIWSMQVEAGSTVAVRWVTPGFNKVAGITVGAAKQDLSAGRVEFAIQTDTVVTVRWTG